MGLLGDVLGPVLGFFGQQSTNSANQAIASGTNATAEADTSATNAQNLAIAQANDQMQYDFAQHGLSWKIQDAAANGISPLAAIGAAGASASPAVAVMQSPPLVTPQFTSPLSAAAAAIHVGSQNVSRGLSSEQSPTQKASDLLELARRSKENDLLDVQIALAKKNLITQPGTPPGIPSATVTVHNADGSDSVIPSEAAARGSHGELFGPLLWSLHNGIIPSVQNLWQNTVTSGAYSGSSSDTANENYR
jgi:hypothetical protein